MVAHKEQRASTQLIPNDITIEIVLRLPVKSLLRFRCVCKSWKYLITSSRFIGMHLHHATEDSCNKVILLSHNSFRSLDYEASTAKVEKLNFPLKAPDGLEVLGSCNGVLCIAIHKRGVIVLWNPSIRKYKIVSLMWSSRDLPCIYGFGYNSTIDDYKVVKIFTGGGKIEDWQVEMYTLKSNFWRMVLKRPPFQLEFGPVLESGTLVNGALYWLVHVPLPIPCGKHQQILCFDLKDDTWIVTQLPHDVNEDSLNLKLRDFGGSLCIFKRDHGDGIKLWTLKENNYERSWIKLMNISIWEEMPSRGYLVPVCSAKNGKILLKSGRFDKLKKTFCLYTPKEEGKFRELEHCGIRSWSQEVTYTESLVSPDRRLGMREEGKSVADISN